MTGFVLPLALAWFFIVNCVASVGALTITGVARSRGVAGEEWSPSALLALRLMPAAMSVFFVAALFVPAFVRLEPEGMRETLGRTGLLLAAAALAAVLRAIARVVASVARTRRVVFRWSIDATRVRLKGVHLPSYLVETEFPVMSLVGILKPRLFIARQVYQALTPSELKSAVAHELAHVRARDNVKRLVVAMSPDLVGWSPAGRRLEASWRAAAEFAADARAVGGNRRRAVTLASALVKVARLIANHPRVDYACAMRGSGVGLSGSPRSDRAWRGAGGPAIQSMFHGGGPIVERVERLMRPESVRAKRHSGVRLVMLGAAVLLVALTSFNVAMLAVHSLTEILVRLP
ncbi:MAG: M48 family metalloprotease [Acidobacteria bacterium]|nr:M48 family metalloprotease [Acidobacteriota bacterium]